MHPDRDARASFPAIEEACAAGASAGRTKCGQPWCGDNGANPLRLQDFSLAVRVLALACEFRDALCIATNFATEFCSVRGDAIAGGTSALRRSIHEISFEYRAQLSLSHATKASHEQLLESVPYCSFRQVARSGPRVQICTEAIAGQEDTRYEWPDAVARRSIPLPMHRLRNERLLNEPCFDACASAAAQDKAACRRCVC